MIDKPSFVDSLNIFGITLCFALAAGLYQIIKWFAKLVLKFTAGKAKEAGIKAVANEVAKELMVQYTALVRAEAMALLNPIIKSIKILTKSNKENNKRISAIEKSLKEHRDSEHKHKDDIITVLNFLIDSTTDSLTEQNIKDIKTLRNKLSTEQVESINISCS